MTARNLLETLELYSHERLDYRVVFDCAWATKYLDFKVLSCLEIDDDDKVIKLSFQEFDNLP